jgi:hypothetical protein
MTISYPLTIPDTYVRSVTIRARSVVGLSISPTTLEQQAFAWPGEAWEAAIDFVPLKREDAEPLIALLVALNGREGSFLLGDPLGTTPRGVASGAPKVMGAGQSGKVLVTDGWTPSTTGILKAGDWLQLGAGGSTHLHKMMADANSDGSGLATLDIWPRLRSAPSDDAALIVHGAKGIWRLASNEREWQMSVGKRYAFSVTCIEVI